MKKLTMLLLLIMLLSVLAGCGDQGNPVVKTITFKNGSSTADYSIVYDNKKVGKTSEFEQDDATILFVENGDFISSMDDGKITVSLDKTDLTDVEGNTVEADETLTTIMQHVADHAEHDIFDVKIIIDGDRSFVFEKHNVNLWTPCVLYEYDPADSKLTELYKWDDVELTGIALCGSAVIIGGADGPTSIYLAPGSTGTGEGADNIMGKTSNEPITVSFVDSVENADVWLIPDTEKNRKTSVWGTASIKNAEQEKEYSVSISKNPGDMYLLRMIDIRHIYYESKYQSLPLQLHHERF